MTTTTKPRVRHVSDKEVVVLASRDVAFEHVGEALEKLGSVSQRDSGWAFVEGHVMYGLQRVSIRASLVERGPGETTVVLQGSSDDAWGAGAKNASKRLVELLENLANPGFKVDRLGMNPMALVGIVIGFILFLLWLVPQLERR